MKLSIIIPVFNEKNTILEILKRVEEVDLKNIEKEIIIVDDGSIDGTKDILKKLEARYKIFYHKKNQGKGAAVRQGFNLARGDILLIQDADLEYNPQNYFNLITPILSGAAEVVYGSRFKESNFRHFSLLYNIGNKSLTFISNLLTGFNLTDMETGFKVFKKEVIQKILPYLTSERFGIEQELTVQISKKKYRIQEVKLLYPGQIRTHKQGKKINWKDGVAAIWYIIKFNLFS